MRDGKRASECERERDYACYIVEGVRGIDCVSGWIKRVSGSCVIAQSYCLKSSMSSIFCLIGEGNIV